MEIKTLDEHVFEYRNKAYGAYQLRKNQNRNLLIGMIAVYGVAAFTWGTCKAIGSFFPEKPREKITDFFPDPDMNPESEPVIEKEKAPPGRGSHAQPAMNNLFRIADTLVADTSHLFTPQQTDNGTETIEGIGEEGGTGTEGDGNGNSGTEIFGEDESETRPVQIVEMAAFPGGNDKMEEFIRTNFVFPEKESTGTLVVYFEIDEQGKTRNVKILKSFPGGSLFEHEAIRVISTMPAWSSQKINGKPVVARKEIKINCKQ